MALAAVGASEDQAASARRIGKRELLRDHPAHRDSENMRVRRLRMLEHSRDIRSHLRKRELPVGLVALASAAVVDHENLEAGFHQFQKWLTPSAPPAAEPHAKRNRLAGAANLVAKLEAVCGLRKVT